MSPSAETPVTANDVPFPTVPILPAALTPVTTGITAIIGRTQPLQHL